MSLKVSNFKVIKLNKYLGIVIVLAFLSTTFVSLKLTYGQSGNLTRNQTNGLAQNQTEAYGDTLMDVIRNANITIPSDLHPTTNQLEQIVDEIVNGGHPSKILDEMRQNKSNS
jgi:hypothetical protein